jgi:predicted nucleic acid-binding Zn ribbon protein
VICAVCGTENRPGRRFCSQCGHALSVACPSCSATNEPGDRFCGECGMSLDLPPPAEPATRAGPDAERRLVSVLFADLVGFTALSENRDARAVPRGQRTLLDRGDPDREGRVARGAGPGRGADTVLSEARAIFERLKAHPWLERVDRSSSARAVASSGT